MNPNAQPHNIHSESHSTSSGMRDSSGIIGAEQRRAALRQSLQQNPGDNALFEALGRLTTPKHIARSAQAGVFINYARNDELFAIDLASALEAAGVAVWLDSLHIDEMQAWDEQVEEALRTCGVMLSVISPEAIQDAHAKIEREKAVYAGKMVIPVMGQHGKVPKQPFLSAEIDFSSDFNYGMQQLLNLFSIAPASV